MEALKRNWYNSSNKNSTGNFTAQVPNEAEREAMLSCLAEELGCDQLLGEEPGRLRRLARATPGFLASDLALLLSRIVSSYASSSSAAALHQPGRKKGGKF
jgi:hypothetical protein